MLNTYKQAILVVLKAIASILCVIGIMLPLVGLAIYMLVTQNAEIPMSVIILAFVINFFYAPLVMYPFTDYKSLKAFYLEAIEILGGGILLVLLALICLVFVIFPIVMYIIYATETGHFEQPWVIGSLVLTAIWAPGAVHIIKTIEANFKENT